MARAVPFKQADLQRAIRGAKAGGLEIGRVEITPVAGTIVIYAARESVAPENALDTWLSRHAG